MEETDTLNLPASQKNLLQLAQAGSLDVRAYERALRIIGFTPDTDRWNRFLNVLLLVLGAGLTVCGIYFFFAYNWSGMHRFVKLGIVEVMIIGLVVSAFILSLDKLTGKIILTVAGVLVGALLAVYGQVYQTGADSYTLFLYWTLFMAGWVFISCFTPMWFVWILLINTTLILYWNQVAGYRGDSKLMLLVFAVNGLFILLWEFFNRRFNWLVSRWTPRIISLAVFYVVTAAAVYVVVGERDNDIYISALAILFVIVNAVVLYTFSQKNLDMFMLTISAISLMIVLDTWLADILDKPLDDFLSLFLGVVVIAETALTVTLLLRTSKSWEARKQ